MCSLNHHVAKQVVKINAHVTGRSLNEVSQDKTILINRRGDIPEVGYFLVPYFMSDMREYLSFRHAGQ
jgi:hypothetical protein